MVKKKKTNNKAIIVIIPIIAVALLGIIIALFVSNNSSPITCKKGEILDKNIKKCVSKPKVVNGEELKADSILRFEIKENNTTIFSISSETLSSLEITYDPTFTNVDTGDKYIYIDPETNTFETISNQEVNDLKNKGEVCLDGEDAWSNIGKDTCVAFFPTYWYKSKTIMFMNEKKEYRDGFVAPIMSNFISWEDLLAQYEHKTVAVSGTIERYEGHPEIKVYSSRALKIATPVGWSSSKGTIYTME